MDYLERLFSQPTPSLKNDVNYAVYYGGLATHATSPDHQPVNCSNILLRSSETK